jgi:hypothetical protein
MAFEVVPNSFFLAPYRRQAAKGTWDRFLCELKKVLIQRLHLTKIFATSLLCENNKKESLALSK